MKNGNRQGGGRILVVALLVFSFAAGALLVVLLKGYTGLERRTGEVTVTKEEPPSIPVPEPVARVAIVIDDMGTDLGKLESLIDLDVPVTVSVLPHLRHSRDVAEMAHASGLEVMLHLPMEPINPTVNNPGDGALFTGMPTDEIRSLLLADIESIPYLSGVNNHMGSRFTEDERGMRVVFEVLSQRGFFFLDSRTSPRSIALKLAHEFGVRSASRNVFLDNKREKEYIRGQFEELLRVARKRGRAIAIGHPYPETISVLKEALGSLEDEGIEVVSVSELME